jgi:hypothetical protein
MEEQINKSVKLTTVTPRLIAYVSTEWTIEIIKDNWDLNHNHTDKK